VQGKRGEVLVKAKRGGLKKGDQTRGGSQGAAAGLLENKKSKKKTNVRTP